MGKTTEVTGGLDRAFVFSATEENVRGDLLALKATYLLTEDLRLVSNRLCHALLELRDIKGNDSKEEFADLERALQLPQYERIGEQGGVVVPGTPPDRQSVNAIRELAAGVKANKFSLAPFSEVVEVMRDLAIGKRRFLEETPVFDQPTMNRLRNFYQFTVKPIQSDAQGPLSQPNDLDTTVRALLANEFLIRMPDFPEADWDFLSKMRSDLTDARAAMLRAMHELNQGAKKIQNIEDITEFARNAWTNEIKGDISDMRVGLARAQARRPMSIAGNGYPAYILAVGLAVTGVIIHHPGLTTTGCLATSVTALADGIAAQVDRKSQNRQINVRPYLFFSKAVNEWKVPKWP